MPGLSPVEAPGAMANEVKRIAKFFGADLCGITDFDKRWLEARNIEELRNVVLLAERKRFLRK